MPTKREFLTLFPILVVIIILAVVVLQSCDFQSLSGTSKHFGETVEVDRLGGGFWRMIDHEHGRVCWANSNGGIVCEDL